MGHPTSLFTGGGLVSSAPDVARFSIALDDGRLVKPATLKRAWTAIVTPDGRTLPYGLGWFVQRDEGRTLVWHYGHFFETSTLIVKIPERRMTFVVLANADGLSRWRNLGKGNLLTSPAAALFLRWYSNQSRLAASR
jgi:CubicO group peptidase (beta-lactamase class C family)